MPFTLPKDSNKVIIKKPIDNTSTNVISSVESIGVDSTSIILNSIKLNGTLVTPNTITKLAYSDDVTPGIAQAEKAIVVDENKDISGINIINCSGLILKGSQIDPRLFTKGAEKGDLTNIYVNDVYRGAAKENKALISDYDYSIQNINSLGIKSLKLNKKNILMNDININTDTNLNSDSDVDTSNLFTFTWKFIKSNNNYLSLAYSEINNIYVAVGNKISTSKDGFKWVEVLTNNYNSVCWSSKLNLFVAVGNNFVSYSSNGTSWSDVNVADKSWKSVCWSDVLELFICVGTNASMYSSDGVTWTIKTTTTTMKLIKWIPNHNVFVGISDTNLFISTNGIYWSMVLSLENTYLSDICFSKELSRVIISSVYNGMNYILYSDDSQTWKFANDYPNYDYYTLAWSKYLNLFVGLSNKDNKGYYSSDGIVWYEFVCDGSINSLLWSRNYKKFIGVGNGILNSISIGAEGITTDKIFVNNDGNMGLGIESPTSKLEILDNNGKCLKISNYNNSLISTSTFDVNNKVLTIQPLNLQTDYDTYGLMLNNQLVKSNVSDLNKYLTNITPGTVTANSVVSSNNSRNISGISSISTSSLIVGGNNRDTTSNHATFKDVNVGKALPNKALILDQDRSIQNINNYKTNKLYVNNTCLKLNSDVNLNCLDVINYVDNIVSTDIAKDYVGTNNNLIWVDYLSLFVLINDSGLTYSKDGINWFTIDNNKWNGIAWSSKLNKLVVVGEKGIMVSNNGLNWADINFANTINCVHWSVDLEMFLASSDGHVYISTDGYNWATVDVEYNFIDIVWYNDMYVAITDSDVYVSNDCITWEVKLSKTNIKNLSWSIELLLITSDSGVFYSKDGLDWIDTTYEIKKINWLVDMKAYMGSDDDNIYISLDGIKWDVFKSLLSNNKSNIVFAKNRICLFDKNGFVTNDYTSNYKINNDCLYTHPEHIRVNYINKRVGLGVDPQYALHLSTDNAASQSSTWAVASDERLKKNIEDANLDMCSYNVKNLRLAKYDFLPSIDKKSKLGWIAQEVANYIPEAVTEVDRYGIPDCKNLDIDPIIANMYGSIQNLISMSEKINSLCADCNEQINKIMYIKTNAS